MDLSVFDKNLEDPVVLDDFESLIWTDRYCGYGEFEIYTKVSAEVLTILQQDYYITLKDSAHVMIIEDCKITSEVEQGRHLTVTGRSLESILDRRIIWGIATLSGNLQNEIHRLLNENVIFPTIPDRKIPNFIFEYSDDPAITALTVDAQFTRTNLYETIQKLCATNNIGFRITISDTNQFVFKLYSGVNRSYDQFLNPFVVFSPNFENIISSDYTESKKALKTVTVVAGEGEGTSRKTTIVGGGTALERRELYTDARDLSQTVDDVTFSDEEYLAQLVRRGTEKLGEHVLSKSFEGQADTTNMFKYGVDFFLGDITEIDSGYGIAAKSRVTEMIYSQNASGINTYPTFAMVDVNQFEGDGVLDSGTEPGDSAAKILEKLKTVDGIGSGLDADLLDGLHAINFLQLALGVSTHQNLIGGLNIYGDKGLGIFSWGQVSANNSGWALFGQNCYLSHSSSEFKFVNAHASFGARGILLKWGGETTLYWFDTGNIPTVVDGVFTPSLKKIWHDGANTDSEILNNASDLNTQKAYIKQIPRDSTTIMQNANHGRPYVTTVSNGLGLLGLPVAGWYHIQYFRHLDNNGYGAQIAIPLNHDGAMCWRRGSGTTWGAWRLMWDNANTTVDANGFIKKV